MTEDAARIMDAMRIICRVLSNVLSDLGSDMSKEIVNRSSGFVLNHLDTPILPILIMKIKIDKSIGSRRIPNGV